jgi:ABC-type multidrug transport system ATPase subunit
MSAVAVEGVWKFYGDFPALRDIRLQADAGCLPGAYRAKWRW